MVTVHRGLHGGIGSDGAAARSLEINPRPIKRLPRPPDTLGLRLASMHRHPSNHPSHPHSLTQSATVLLHAESKTANQPLQTDTASIGRQSVQRINRISSLLRQASSVCVQVRHSMIHVIHSIKTLRHTVLFNMKHQ